MKKILVPVDFSEYSEYALQAAAMIAKKLNAEIMVLHMLGLSEAILTKDESQEVAEAMYYMKLAEKRFETFLDKDYLKGFKVSETVQNYKIFREINQLAIEQEVDLIVMGSHGVSGLHEEVFIGSNSETVVRTSSFPVFVVNNPTEKFGIKDVVFACDFKHENIKAYLRAIRLFELFAAKVHLLYINLPGDKFRSSEQIEERIKEFLFKAELGDLDRYKDVVIYNDFNCKLFM